jgi:hypothetical protein
MSSIVFMGNKKAASDRHKPGRMVRVPEVLARQLDLLAEKNVTNPTQETIRAIREMLAREGLWPIKNKD